MTHSLHRYRRSFFLFGLILAGALMLLVVPGGILADQQEESSADTENDLTIEQFQPISISHDMFTDLEDIEELSEEFDPATLMALYIEVQDLGELDTNLTEDSFRHVESIDEVDSHLGGEFAMPQDLPEGIESGESHFGVGDAGYASYTFDVEKAHRISELLDLPTDWLPDPSEQSELTVSVEITESGMAGWKSGDDKLITGQIGTPDIDIPEEIDLETLRNAVIDDPRMPDELADQLGAIEDWDSTVPVPVPDEAEYEDATIDGGTGFVMSMDDGQGTVAVWQADDTLHFVAGSYSSDEILSIAESVE